MILGRLDATVAVLIFRGRVSNAGLVQQMRQSFSSPRSDQLPGQAWLSNGSSDVADTVREKQFSTDLGTALRVTGCPCWLVACWCSSRHIDWPWSSAVAVQLPDLQQSRSLRLQSSSINLACFGSCASPRTCGGMNGIVVSEDIGSRWKREVADRPPENAMQELGVP